MAKTQKVLPMQPTVANKRGFTIVEMLVVVPVVMLTVMVIVGFIIVLTGNVLQSRERTRIVYDVQTSLDRVEHDIRLANQFMNSLAVNSPQGPGTNGATGTFQSASSLIVEQNATTKNPIDPTRQLIYLANQPNPCATNRQFNANLKIYTIYFLKDSTLWRRSIVPPTTACDKPWQRNSCPDGFSISTSICRAEDEALMSSVDEFTITYLVSVGSDTVAASAAEAGAIDVRLKASAEIAGKKIVQTSGIRASYVNSSD